MMLRVFFIATRRKTYGKLSIVFLILSYKHEKFYDFSTSKLLANFRVILVLNFQNFLFIFSKNSKISMVYK
ncbi:hypothetical protein FWK35_00000830 [Aphis craccivora]|uniref:Uncharacterized protein n=1 Tax=Aphis craccivora TaxID=307492 RepID=A0A6G0ZNV8_APHCR|nr:hypothetical protein FWK35_00000830 [Aphis craccivora]